MKVVARPMIGSEGTLKILSRLFSEKHIQAAIDDRLRTYYGIYDLMRGISSGYFQVYGLWDEESSNFLGWQLGHFQENGVLAGHSFLKRHVPAVECCKAAVFAAKKDAAARRKYFTGISGLVPVNNKPMQKTLLAAGYVDRGIVPGVFLLKNKKNIPCREFFLEA